MRIGLSILMTMLVIAGCSTTEPATEHPLLIRYRPPMLPDDLPETVEIHRNSAANPSDQTVLVPTAGEYGFFHQRGWFMALCRFLQGVDIQESDADRIIDGYAGIRLHLEAMKDGVRSFARQAAPLISNHSADAIRRQVFEALDEKSGYEMDVLHADIIILSSSSDPQYMEQLRPLMARWEHIQNTLGMSDSVEAVTRWHKWDIGDF